MFVLILASDNFDVFNIAYELLKFSKETSKWIPYDFQL